MSEPCPLWVLLVQKFALGTISAIELQHLADAAVKSGASTPEMLQLQGLGAMGQQSGNVHRDLLRKCFTHLQAPAPYKLTCQMAMKVAGEKCLTECDCFVLLPHQWVESLQQGELLVNLTCTDNDLILFWESQKKNLGQIPQYFYFVCWQP